MSRKDYELFAAMLRNIPSASLRLKFAEALIPVLKGDNSNFKEGTFRKAADCTIDIKGNYSNDDCDRDWGRNPRA